MKTCIFLFISIVLVSCYSANKRPSNIIKPKEMQGILWDVMRAQTLASETALKDSTLDVAIEIKILSTKAFQIHKTDSANFARSYNWYLRHPDKLKLIFDSIYIQKQRQHDTSLKRKAKLLGHPQ
ncbi:MAG: DUF4296 domain-containing protein [Ginsengibacter sp.]